MLMRGRPNSNCWVYPYFDDAFHDPLGLDGDQFQDLYHFTIGGPVDDPWLATPPAYAHLR
jgi:hypothetical protein